MSRIGGCVLALVGVAVAVCSVIGGLMGFYGAAVDGDTGAEGVYMGLVLSGGIIGLVVFIAGTVIAISRK